MSDPFSDRARLLQYAHDIERYYASVSDSTADSVSLDANPQQRSFANAMYEALYQSLAVTPWGIGWLLERQLPKPTPALLPRPDISAGAVIGVLVGIIVGATLEAPFAAGGNCLENLIGSWLMRLHHSHEAYAFHSGWAQGKYAIAGAIATLPVMTILATGRACLSDTRYKSFREMFALVILFPLVAAGGAAAAAIAAARGFHVQLMAHSATANVAGEGFILMVMCFVVIPYRLLKDGGIQDQTDIGDDSIGSGYLSGD